MELNQTLINGNKVQMKIVLATKIMYLLLEPSSKYHIVNIGVYRLIMLLNFDGFSVKTFKF